MWRRTPSLYFRVEAASCRFQKKRRDAASTLQAAEPALLWVAVAEEFYPFAGQAHGVAEFFGG